MQTWDPTNHVLIVGAHTVTGYAPDTFITASRNEDSMSLEVGADGTPARIRNANKSGRFTITLMKSSPSNDYLATLHSLDEESGAGIVPVLVKDNNNLAGTAVASANAAWIVKPADYERGKELGTQQWILETGQLNISSGGISDIVPT